MKEIYELEDYATTEEIPAAFKLSHGNDTSVHTHAVVEIFYVIDGVTYHKFNGRQQELLEAGDCFLILPGVNHEFIHVKNSLCTHRDVMIRQSFFEEVCNFISPSLLEKLKSGELPVRIKLPLDAIALFENKINMFGQMFSAELSRKSAIVRSLAVLIVEPFLTSNIQIQYNNIPSWLRELLSCFDKITFLKSGLKSITKQFNYDQKYICRIFKKYMGITMTDYLNYMRLNYALPLLQNTNKSVSEIAQDLGFASVSYFNVIFKKRYSITPSEVRKKKIFHDSYFPLKQN